MPMLTVGVFIFIFYFLKSGYCLELVILSWLLRADIMSATYTYLLTQAFL